MEHRIGVLFLILSCFVITSCTVTELPPSRYLIWLQENQSNLTWTTEQKNFTFKLIYLPHDRMILRDAGTNLTKQNYPTLKKEYEGLEYYTLKITGKGRLNLLDTKAGNRTNYEDRLNYCAFDMQKDIKLIVATDTLNCHLFHFERTFKASPTALFMLGFDKPKFENSNRKIVLNAQELGFIPLSWTIPNDVIQNIPKLKL